MKRGTLNDNNASSSPRRKKGAQDYNYQSKREAVWVLEGG